MWDLALLVAMFGELHGLNGEQKVLVARALASCVLAFNFRSFALLRTGGSTGLDLAIGSGILGFAKMPSGMSPAAKAPNFCLLGWAAIGCTPSDFLLRT